MNHRLSVRLPDELAEGIDARARHSGKTKSAVVRDTLTNAGLAVKRDVQPFPELLKRAAALRARQPEMTDVVALLREVRDGSPLRLRLRRLNIPFMEADLA